MAVRGASRMMRRRLQALESRLLVGELDQGGVRVAVADGQRVAGHVGGPAVDLAAHPAEAQADVEAQHAVVAGEQRRRAPAVGLEWRDHHPVRARGEDRAARGHAVRARPQRRGHHGAVAGHARVEVVVDADGDEDLAGAGADHGDVVDGDTDRPIVGGDLEAGDRLGGEAAGLDLVERVDHRAGLHRRQHADAAAGHGEHRARRVRSGVQGVQRGAVAADGEQEVAVRGVDGVDHGARLADDRHLPDGDAVRGGPVEDRLHDALDVSRRVHDEPQLAQRGHRPAAVCHARACIGLAPCRGRTQRRSCGRASSPGASPDGVVLPRHRRRSSTTRTRCGPARCGPVPVRA